MIEADRADHSRAKLDHDLIVPITRSESSAEVNRFICEFYTNPHYGKFDKINPATSAQ